MPPRISVDPAMDLVSNCGPLVAGIAMFNNCEGRQLLCKDRHPTKEVACFDLISPLPDSVFSNEELPRAMDILTDAMVNVRRCQCMCSGLSPPARQPDWCSDFQLPGFLPTLPGEMLGFCNRLSIDLEGNKEGGEGGGFLLWLPLRQKMWEQTQRERFMQNNYSRRWISNSS